MTAHHEFLVPDESPMRIAVISDTHSKAHPRALELIKALSPDLILHAGDIGELAVLSPFEELAETIYVRGNIDATSAGPKKVSIALRGNDGYELRIAMTHIALYGPRIRKDAKLFAKEHNAHLLVCGHSHVPFLGQEGKLVAFNPGSIGPRRFPLPITFGLCEFGPGVSSIRHINCESGETWLP